jgi:hypothetical protein
MTSSSEEKVTCPQCGHQQRFTIWGSINVTLNPELKQDLLTGTLNRFVCEGCGTRTNVNYGTLYHDMKQAVLILLTYDGPQEDLSKVGRMFRKHRIRIVGSPYSLREKVYIFDAGLDDRMVELFKVFVLALMSRDGRKAKELLFDSMSDQDGQKEIDFVALGEGEPTKVSVPWAQYETMAAKYASSLPNPKTEEGKWLRVDADYLKALGLLD